MNNTVKRN